MKLIELLEITDENTNVLIRDTNGNDLAIYDGKNSINEIYNDCEVINQFITDNWLIVEIKNNVKIIYDNDIDKYYTFNQFKEDYEKYTEETATDETIKHFVFMNLIQNGGCYHIIDLADVIEDSQNGVPSAKQFLLNL